MQNFSGNAVSSFCDAAANFLGDFEQAVIATLSNEAATLVGALIDLDTDCRNEHEVLALIFRDATALRRSLLDEGIFDAHILSANAVAATARNVERLCAGTMMGGSEAH